MKNENDLQDNFPLVHTGGETHILKEIFRAHHALLMVFTRKVGIPASRMAVVRMIAVAHPEALGVMDIARRLGINAAAVTRQVSELEGEGLVIRKTDLSDSRKSLIKLSPKGLRIARKYHERMHEFERELVGHMQQGEIETAVRVLSQIQEICGRKR
jgi:DNA-binding MarR family transcriptional regulator